MDRKHVFADKLELVTGFVFHRSGVIAATSPDIWYLEDTNGDEVADKRTKLYTGLGTADTHAVREVGCQSRVRRLVHQRQRSSNAFLGDQTEEWRLLELNRESVPHRVVEHRVAGSVGELREHDGVGAGEFRSLVQIEVRGRSG